MEDCIFCKIIKGDIPCNKVFEDEHTLAFLDIAPVSKGHVLVIPKEHTERTADLSEVASTSLMNSLKKVASAVGKSFDCDYNILNNNGAKSGQAVFHVHFHIIPRRGDSEEFFFNWKPLSYGEGEDKELLGKIVQAL